MLGCREHGDAGQLPTIRIRAQHCRFVSRHIEALPENRIAIGHTNDLIQSDVRRLTQGPSTDVSFSTVMPSAVKIDCGCKVDDDGAEDCVVPSVHRLGAMGPADAVAASRSTVTERMEA